MENGCLPYADAQIHAAPVRAGVLPLEKPLSRSRTVRAGQVAATATVGTAAITAIQDNLTSAQDILAGLAPHLDAA